MRTRWILTTLAVLTAAGPGVTARTGHDLAATWTDPGFERRYLHTLFVIGISDLTQARKNFENMFVSHLRTLNYEGVTSYSLVPRLQAVGDREALVKELRERKVDGAITVRLVPLNDRTEAEWGEAWDAWVKSGPRILGLIEASLPLPEKKAKRYGVEVALWDSTGWTLVWAARTDTYKRKELADAAGDFVDRTMDALWNAGFLK